MKARKIKLAENINVDISIPGSKSITNRALLISALANGKSVVKNPLLSDDSQFMIHALRQFGIKIEVNKDEFIVYGKDRPSAPQKKVYIGNAGTAMRFLTGFAALADGKTIITGNDRMKKRPIGDLTSALRELGINATEVDSCPPVTIHGGRLPGGSVTIKGDISSQFISSLLMVAPYADKPLAIKIEGKLISKPYVDVTLSIMKKFGVAVIHKNHKIFYVPQKRYKCRNYSVESDASSASYFFVAAAITRGSVFIKNTQHSIQGDIRFVDVLKKMGCEIKRSKSGIEVKGKELKGITVDMNSIPDVVQTAAIVALFAKGKTIIKNVAHLRYKETDRLRALAAQLRKIGANVKEKADGIEILPDSYHGARIETYGDHRMAMSFAIAGLRIPNIQIENPNVVSKSFPTFWKIFTCLYGTME